MSESAIETQTNWPEFIFLRSERSLWTFSPEEYKEHVRSLFKKPEPRKASAKRSAKKPFVWRLNAKGTLVLRVNRKPRWLSREEIEQIARESGKPQNEVWLKVAKLKIRISTEEEERRMEDSVAAIPW